MKRTLKHPALISMLVAFFGCVQNEEITDIIKLVNLTAGKKDSMLVSDMFYSEKYDLEIEDNPNVKVSFDKTKGMIYFTPDMNFSGMTLVDFKFDGEMYSIPVQSNVQRKFKFAYKPEKKYNKLTLFGSFNGWDRGNLPIEDKKGNGIYEVEIPLEPGRYEYKFWGDGEEIVDPNNPSKVPNGFGDYNSVFIVEEPKLGKLFLHIGGKEETNDKFNYRFIYENEKDGSQISDSNLIALLNNQRVPSKNIKIKNGIIEFAFSKLELNGKKLLRTAVSKNGRSTNIQSVFLKDGIPSNNEKDFNWHDAIIYSLMIDRFNDGDKSLNKPVVQDSLFDKVNYMGGDFQGIINKINEGYFDSLGINTIWLSPVYDNPNEAFKESPSPHRWFSGYHGYWPINSYDVEEKFGTLDKLKELVNTAHNHNIKILLDVVANHVHEQHPLFKQHPEWFGELKLPDGRLNLRLWDEYRLTTWFEPYLPKFNFVESKEAIDFMASNALWWLETTGADGFRQDAVKHIPNTFWRTLTRKLKSEYEISRNVDLYQVGETYGSYELINSYVNNGQLNAQFNFNLYDVALPTFIVDSISFGVLNSEIHKSFRVYGVNNLMGNIMDSHDKNRFMSFADGDLEISQWSATEEGWNNPPKVDNPENYKKAELYYAYMNSIPGLPVIYYGSEFGMTGASDPDNRRMMRFGNDLSKYERDMLSNVRNIINVRKNHPALRYGDFLTLLANKNIFAFIRSDMNERVLVILNKSDILQTVELELPGIYNIKSVKDLLTDDKYAAVNNRIEVEMKGGSYKYLILE